MRILLAEDELPLAKALLKIFEKNNCSADAVHNGRDALCYLESGIEAFLEVLDGCAALTSLWMFTCVHDLRALEEVQRKSVARARAGLLQTSRIGFGTPDSGENRHVEH